MAVLLTHSKTWNKKQEVEFLSTLLAALAPSLVQTVISSVYSFEIEYIPQELLKKSEINQLLTIYLEYKIMMLLCVDCIVLLSYDICLQEKLCQIILICFLPVTIKRMTK